MTYCNSVSTPSSTVPLVIDVDRVGFSEDWEYAAIVEMLMYLAQNFRPEIIYAVHQCVRFTHAPRKSHVVRIKSIIRYLQGTKDEGLIIKPSNSLQVNCYVDVGFAGLWNIKQDQDPLCVKSRTGYLIMFMGCPLT